MNKIMAQSLICGAVLTAVPFCTLAGPAGANVPGADVRLVQAVKSRDAQAVQGLLKGHADVNAAEADGATPLMWAAHWGDVEEAKALLGAGANVNAVNGDGATALWLASNDGNAGMVELLLKAGASANQALPSGETPLMAAAQTNADVVNVLLAHGADVNAKKTHGGQTALMWAVAKRRPDVVKALIAHGVEVNAHSESGYTPLMFAVQQADMEEAKALLDGGAKVNEAAKDGGTPLLIAATRADAGFISFLLDKGADPNLADSDGYTPLYYVASRRTMLDSVKALLAHKADPNVRLVKNPARGDSSTVQAGATPFFMATYGRNLDIMRTLLASGADPKMPTSNTVFVDGGASSQGRRLQMIAGTTPFLVAAGSGKYKGDYSPLSDAEEANAIEALKMLLDLGANVNEVNAYGQTALHAAAYIGADKIIQFLVDRGANVNAMDKFQQTPLSIALEIHTIALGGDFDEQPRRYYKETVTLLTKLGAKSLDDLGVPYIKQDLTVGEIKTEGAAGL